jgi:hypothetical protein
MNTEEQAKADVHRLHDILVEEVSLVDRAANKHRFLIVKRDDDMGDTNDNDSKDEPIIDLNDEDGEEQTDESQSDDDANDGDAATNSAALALAVEALEGLTETVELLGTASNENAMPRLTELASGLRTVSEQLVAMTGATNDNADAAKNVPGSNDKLANTLGAVRTSLQQVSELLRTQASASKTNAPDDKRSSNANASDQNNLGDQLSALTNEVKILTSTVKEQQQRIARLEKRAGLPNSKPVGEKPRRVAKNDQDEDEGWPLDMNRSLDRESVDKSTSFHDV